MSNDSETLWLKEKFAKYDADGSGDIDVSELQTLMSEVTGETPTAPEVAGFIEAVDADSDGKLDFEEFVAIFLRARSGDLEFGGLRLAMDAFNDLIADELDGDDDARPPSPTPERRSSALGAPEAKRPEDGLVGGHAYSLIAAAEAEGFRLLKLRNPWGNFEWTGAWSDGSELWKTHPKVAKRCGVDPAKPDDDGVFWIEYGDFLKYYDSVDVLKKSEDLHDIYLDTHESWRCCGPCRGLVEGCCCYYAACRGGFKLCCGRETGDETVAAAPKRDCCCPGGKKPARDVEAG